MGLISKNPFLKKYLLSAYIISAFLFLLIISLIYKNLLLGVLMVVLLINMVWIVKKFLFPLKNVFLNNEKSELTYRNKGIEYNIPLKSIVEIKIQRRFGKIISVKYQNKFESKELMFIPKEKKLYKELYEKINVSKENVV
ncbi:hypothetical protein PG614_10290 [Riemerella anatipestifer]|nr:hypothetical protein [Riemerella anatipestifer]MDY3534277.1 hypothetical protein [Riemerella anatipestifer]MDY3536335.1 hypothetical protein [Riemerella anatipestifer]